jgi:hypothetical protein
MREKKKLKKMKKKEEDEEGEEKKNNEDGTKNTLFFILSSFFYLFFSYFFHHFLFCTACHLQERTIRSFFFGSPWVGPGVAQAQSLAGLTPRLALSKTLSSYFKPNKDEFLDQYVTTTLSL